MNKTDKQCASFLQGTISFVFHTIDQLECTMVQSGPVCLYNEKENYQELETVPERVAYIFFLLL
jgi:hypothetical protein